MDEPQKLMLIDGYSLLFRAFFGGRPLTTSDGRPTGALFGFTNMLLSLLNNEKPHAMVVCWDAHSPTLRSQAYAEYKAHRPEADPALKAQFPVARTLVEAFGIASAELPGYEADDLIGTLATRGESEGYQVFIITGDSDQLQMVGPNIKVQMTRQGVSDMKLYDAEAVRERYGIGPEQIADYKGLTGDSSDNIPGVPGIGEKTATALLQKFGNMENLLEHLDEVTPPRAQNALKENIEIAKFSKELATIVRDAPLEFTIKPYSPDATDWERVREFFLGLEFKSLTSRLPSLSPLEIQEAFQPEGRLETEFCFIESDAALQQAIAEALKAEWLGLRFEREGTGALQSVIKGVAFSASPEKACYVPISQENIAAGETGTLFGCEPEEGYTAPLALLRPLFEAEGPKRVTHDLKPAFIALQRAGILPCPFALDTLLAAYLLESDRSAYPLTDIASTYLGLRIEPAESFTQGHLAMLEAAALAALPIPLYEHLKERKMEKILDDIEMPLVPVLAAVEQRGLLVDRPYLSTLGERMGRQIEEIAETIYAIAGTRFNIGSPKQLQEVLFEKMKLPTGKKTKTGYSTGADLLETLAAEHEIARKITEYRELAKLKATYADALIRLADPVSGRIHTSLNQTVAGTGRLSSSDPNLQNIPIRSEVGREIRRGFIASPGKVLLSCDYSQVELRILAHVTGDPTLTEAFLLNEDIHAATASTVFGVDLDKVSGDQRRQAKTINFAVLYGQSAFALSQTLGVEQKMAAEWIEAYFARLPGVQKYLEDTRNLAHEQGYVQTMLGRRRYFPDIHSSRFPLRQAAERAAINMPIQGAAADIMKIAMISVEHMLEKRADPGCTLLLQVHDELLFEVEEGRENEFVPDIVRLMSEAYPMNVPLRADAKAGPSWADMKAVG